MSFNADWISTPAKSKNFYQFTLTASTQENSAFLILLKSFKLQCRKRQALFLVDLFVDGNVPQALEGYMMEVNLPAEAQKTTSTKVRADIASLGMSFADKVANRGLLGAISLKFKEDTRISAERFDDAEREIASLVYKNHGTATAGNKYRPETDYAAIVKRIDRYATIKGKEASFRQLLMDAGFADAATIFMS